MNNHELKFLEKFVPTLSKNNILQGNEDAVAWVTPQQFENQVYVCNVDTIAWSSDALPGDMLLSDFGAKIVTVTLSDLVAKGAQPYFFLCSLSSPKNQNEAITDILIGVQQQCNQLNVSYLGGDLNTTQNIHSELVLTGIGIGFTPKESLIRRSTANSGDIVCVSGDFGYTGLGFEIYLKKSFNLASDHPLLPTIRKKLTKPIPRVDLIPYLRKFATSAIDSSDGLILSLYHLSNESNIQIILEKLPISKDIIEDKILKSLANKNLLDFLEITGYAGEEFEIVFTIKESEFSNLQKELQKENLPQIQKIGIVQGGNKGIFYNGLPLKIQGWDSLSEKS